MSMNQSSDHAIRRTRGRIGVACAFIAIFSMTSGCAAATAQTPPAGPSDVEYEIYSLLLDTIFSEVTPDTFYVHETTAIDDNARPTGIVPRILGVMPTVSSELIEAYMAANVDSLEFEADRFQTQRPVVLRGYGPGEKIIFSRIGFSADGSEAVVHSVFGCGTRCGGGYVRRLEKIDGHWVFKEGMETFIM